MSVLLLMMTMLTIKMTMMLTIVTLKMIVVIALTMMFKTTTTHCYRGIYEVTYLVYAQFS